MGERRTGTRKPRSAFQKAMLKNQYVRGLVKSKSTIQMMYVAYAVLGVIIIAAIIQYLLSTH